MAARSAPRYRSVVAKRRNSGLGSAFGSLRTKSQERTRRPQQDRGASNPSSGGDILGLAASMGNARMQELVANRVGTEEDPMAAALGFAEHAGGQHEAGGAHEEGGLSGLPAEVLGAAQAFLGEEDEGAGPEVPSAERDPAGPASDAAREQEEAAVAANAFADEDQEEGEDAGPESDEACDAGEADQVDADDEGAEAGADADQAPGPELGGTDEPEGDGPPAPADVSGPPANEGAAAGPPAPANPGGPATPAAPSAPSAPRGGGGGARRGGGARGGGGGGSSRRARGSGRALARLQKEITGMSPAELATEIDRRVNGFRSRTETLRLDVDAKANTIGADVPSWQSAGQARVEAAEAGVPGKVAGIFDAPRSEISTSLLDVPSRVAMARDNAIAAVEASAAGLRSSAESALAAVMPEATGLKTEFKASFDAEEAASIKGLTTVAGQLSGQATAAGEREAKRLEKEASGTGEAEGDASDSDGPRIARSAGTMAAKDIQGRASEGVTAIENAATKARGLIDGEVVKAEAAVDAAGLTLQADLDAAELEVKSSARTAGDGVIATIDAARSAAAATVDSTEQGLQPAIDQEVGLARADIDSLGTLGAADLPGKAADVLTAMDRNLDAIDQSLDQLRGEEDPEQVKRLLDEVTKNLDTCRKTALDDLEKERAAVRDGISARAQQLEDAVDKKISDAETSAAAAASAFVSTGEGEVSGYESSMAALPDELSTKVDAARDRAVQAARKGIGSSRTTLDGALKGIGAQMKTSASQLGSFAHTLIKDIPQVVKRAVVASRLSAMAPFGDGLGAEEAVQRGRAVLQQERIEAAEVAKVDRATLQGRVDTLVTAGPGGTLTLEALRGLDKYQVQAVKEMYAEKTSRDLVSDLSSRLKGQDLAAAKGYLNGDRVAGALAEIAGAHRDKTFGVATIKQLHPNEVRTALSTLSAQEIDELRARAANDPKAAAVVAMVPDLFDQAKNEAAAAEADFAKVPAGRLEEFGVDPQDPRTLLKKSPNEIADMISDGVVDRETMLNVLKRSGQDPAAYEGLKIVSDPQRFEKEAAHKAELLVDLLDTNLNGAMANTGNAFETGDKRANNDAAMRKLQAEVRAASAGGTLDPRQYDAFKRRYQVLNSMHQHAFNEKMDNLDTAVDTAVVVKEGLKVGATELAGVVGGPAGRAAMSAGLEGLDTAVTERYVNDKSWDESLTAAAQDSALSGATALAGGLAGKAGGLGKGAVDRFASPLANAAAANVAQIAPKAVHGAVREMRNAPPIRPGEKPTDAGDILAKHTLAETASAVVNTGASKLSGGRNAAGGANGGMPQHLSNSAAKDMLISGGTDVLTHNVDTVARNTTMAVADRGLKGEDLDITGELGKQASAHAKALTTRKGLMQNVATPMVSSAAGVGVAHKGRSMAAGAQGADPAPTPRRTSADAGDGADGGGPAPTPRASGPDASGDTLTGLPVQRDRLPTQVDLPAVSDAGPAPVPRDGTGTLTGLPVQRDRLPTQVDMPAIGDGATPVSTRNATDAGGATPTPAADGTPVPSGGVSVADRVAAGHKPKQYALDNPDKYYFDPGSGQYKKRPGAGSNAGRAGKQNRLRQLGADDKVGAADRGWIQNEDRRIRNERRARNNPHPNDTRTPNQRGAGLNVRNPRNSRNANPAAADGSMTSKRGVDYPVVRTPGTELAHARGKGAKDGVSYDHPDHPAQLQDASTHKLETHGVDPSPDARAARRARDPRLPADPVLENGSTLYPEVEKRNAARLRREMGEPAPDAGLETPVSNPTGGAPIGDGPGIGMGGRVGVDTPDAPGHAGIGGGQRIGMGSRMGVDTPDAAGHGGIGGGRRVGMGRIGVEGGADAVPSAAKRTPGPLEPDGGGTPKMTVDVEPTDIVDGPASSRRRPAPEDSEGSVTPKPAADGAATDLPEVSDAPRREKGRYGSRHKHMKEIEADVKLFTDRGPSAGDVHQGEAGTCYLLASMAAVADSDSGAVRRMVTDNGDGTVSVKFSNPDGTAKTVRVTKGVLSDPIFGDVMYAQPQVDGAGEGSSWSPLVEKAYAAKEGGYDAASGGKAAAALETLTGKKSTVLDLPTARKDRAAEGRIKFMKERGFSPGQIETEVAKAAHLKGQGADRAWDKMSDAGARKQPVVLGTERRGRSESEMGAGLVSGHAYTVMDLKVENGRRMVKLRDPHGGRSKEHGKTNGEFWVDFDADGVGRIDRVVVSGYTPLDG